MPGPDQGRGSRSPRRLPAHAPGLIDATACLVRASLCHGLTLLLLLLSCLTYLLSHTQHDTALLASGELKVGSNERNCVVMRHGEKVSSDFWLSCYLHPAHALVFGLGCCSLRWQVVLQYFVDLCDKVSPLLNKTHQASHSSSGLLMLLGSLPASMGSLVPVHAVCVAAWTGGGSRCHAEAGVCPLHQRVSASARYVACVGLTCCRAACGCSVVLGLVKAGKRDKEEEERKLFEGGNLKVSRSMNQ